MPIKPSYHNCFLFLQRETAPHITEKRVTIRIRANQISTLNQLKAEQVGRAKPNKICDPKLLHWRVLIYPNIRGNGDNFIIQLESVRFGLLAPIRVFRIFSFICEARGKYIFCKFFALW